MNIDKIRADILNKVDIIKYGFNFIEDNVIKLDNNFIQIANLKIGDDLNLVFCFNQKENNYSIFFGETICVIEAELSEDFFNYFSNTYIIPSKNLGLHLNKIDYRKVKQNYTLPFRNHNKNLVENGEGLEFDLGSDDETTDIMRDAENLAIFNPFLSMNGSLLSTIVGGNASGWLTNLSASMFTIFSETTTSEDIYILQLLYFPDSSKYNSVSLLKKKVHPELLEYLNLPDDLPIDVFGAITYYFNSGDRPFN